MTIEELMIGDWITCDDCGRVETMQVEELHKYGFNPHYEHGEVTGIHSYEQANPIPLTKEILVRNGFVKSEEDENDGCFDGLDYTFIPCKDGGYNCCFDKKRTISGHFDYVHELQHAFKLVGIDKEIVL